MCSRPNDRSGPVGCPIASYEWVRMSVLPPLTFRNVVSARTFLLGWPFFWRWVLLLQIPYAFVYVTVNMARHGTIQSAVPVYFLLPLGFVVWAIFALGWIALRVQQNFNVPIRTEASSWSVGLSMLWRLAIFGALYVLPAFGISFIAGAAGGFFNGLLQLGNASRAIGEVASYAAHSIIQVFALGVIWERTIAVRVAKEGKTYVGPTVFVGYALGAAPHPGETTPSPASHMACARCARAIPIDASRCDYCGAVRAL